MGIKNINHAIAVLLDPIEGAVPNWAENEDAALELLHSITPRSIVVCDLPGEGYLAMQIKGITLTQSNFPPYDARKDGNQLFEIDVLKAAWSVTNSPHPKACALARLALQILEARK